MFLQMKFAPTMPGRRKKAEDGQAAPMSAADAAAANEAFQNLIKAAQSESKWGTGRGRGGAQVGHGRSSSSAQQHVTFGGTDLGPPPPGTARPSSGAARQPSTGYVCMHTKMLESHRLLVTPSAE